MRCAICGGEFDDLRIDESTGIVACERCHREIETAAEEDDDDESEVNGNDDDDGVEEE